MLPRAPGAAQSTRHASSAAERVSNGMEVVARTSLDAALAALAGLQMAHSYLNIGGLTICTTPDRSRHATEKRRMAGWFLITV